MVIEIFHYAYTAFIITLIANYEFIKDTPDDNLYEMIKNCDTMINQLKITNINEGLNPKGISLLKNWLCTNIKLNNLILRSQFNFNVNKLNYPIYSYIEKLDNIESNITSNKFKENYMIENNSTDYVESLENINYTSKEINILEIIQNYATYMNDNDILDVGVLGLNRRVLENMIKKLQDNGKFEFSDFYEDSDSQRLISTMQYFYRNNVADEHLNFTQINNKEFLLCEDPNKIFDDDYTICPGNITDEIENIKKIWDSVLYKNMGYKNQVPSLDKDIHNQTKFIDSFNNEKINGDSCKNLLIGASVLIVFLFGILGLMFCQRKSRSHRRRKYDCEIPDLS